MINSYQLFKNLNKNEKKIFNLIHKNGAMTKNEIIDKTKMNFTTINRIMKPLEKSGIIVQKCIGESTGGRKPILYDINICKYYIIGIEISKSYIQVSIVNLRMESFYEKSFYIKFSDSPNAIVEQIEKIVNNAYYKLRLDFVKLIGIGVGIESDFGSGIPIKEMLEERLNCNIISENGANAAVIGEYLYGVGRQFKNTAYFYCGNKIRIGTILQDKLIRTLDNNEYAFKHMINNEKDKIDFNKVCFSLQQNTCISEEIILNAALSFGKAVKAYINLLNIECIILNGPLVNSDLFYEACIKSISGKVILRKGGYFKNNTISVGSAAVVIEKFIESGIL